MTDIVERLRAVECSTVRSPDNVTTNWYRNPDGPEAAKEIERLRDRLELYAVKGDGSRGILLGESCDGIACRDEEIQHQKEKIERLRREATDPTDSDSKAWQFQEVMAVLHGDGGHYLAEHGAKKAADDAIDKHYAIRAEIERLCAENAALRARLAEAERLLREIREDAPNFGMPTDRIDAFLASATDNVGEGDGLR